MGNVIKDIAKSISKAFRVDPGRNKPMPRKGLYQFSGSLINKKQQKPYTINPATLGRLANSDPITWAIRRVIKGFVSQTKWDIVADTDQIQTELDRWEDLILSSINPYRFDDTVRFKSEVLERELQEEIYHKTNVIVSDETIDDAEKRHRIRWYFKTLLKRIKQEAESHKHKVKCVFEHPNNTETSFRALLELVLDDVLIYDAGAVIKNYDYYNQLAEIYTVPGHEIKIYRNEDRTMPEPPEPAYVWESQGITRAEFTNDELLYITQNPQHDGYGKSPLEVAAYIITASLYADEYNIDYFKHSNVPPGVLNLGENVSEDQRLHFQKLWEQEIQGRGGLHKLLFAAGTDKMQFLPMRNMSNRDMQMMEYLKWATAIKCACYGISPQDIGFVLDFHRTTSEVQERLSRARGINNILNLLECAFNEEIVKSEFEFKDVKFKWLIDDHKNNVQQAQIDNIDIQQGVLSINERREKLGMKPIEGGDEHTIKGAGQLVPVDDLAKTPEVGQPDLNPSNLGQLADIFNQSGAEPINDTPENSNSHIEIQGEPGRPVIDQQKENGQIKMIVNRKNKKADQYKNLNKAVENLKKQGINATIKIGFDDEKDSSKSS